MIGVCGGRRVKKLKFHIPIEKTLESERERERESIFFDVLMLKGRRIVCIVYFIFFILGRDGDHDRK